KAIWRGQVVAESDRTLEVGGYRYFLREAVRMDLLQAAPKTQSDLACPNGVQFYDVTDGAAQSRRAAPELFLKYSLREPRARARSGAVSCSRQSPALPVSLPQQRRMLRWGSEAPIEKRIAALRAAILDLSASASQPTSLLSRTSER